MDLPAYTYEDLMVELTIPFNVYRISALTLR